MDMPTSFPKVTDRRVVVAQLKQRLQKGIADGAEIIMVEPHELALVLDVDYIQDPAEGHTPMMDVDALSDATQPSAVVKTTHQLSDYLNAVEVTQPTTALD